MIPGDPGHIWTNQGVRDIQAERCTAEAIHIPQDLGTGCAIECSTNGEDILFHNGVRRQFDNTADDGQIAFDRAVSIQRTAEQGCIAINGRILFKGDGAAQDDQVTGQGFSVRQDISAAEDDLVVLRSGGREGAGRNENYERQTNQQWDSKFVIHALSPFGARMRPSARTQTILRIRKTMVRLTHTASGTDGGTRIRT